MFSKSEGISEGNKEMLICVCEREGARDGEGGRGKEKEKGKSLKEILKI